MTVESLVRELLVQADRSILLAERATGEAVASTNTVVGVDRGLIERLREAVTKADA